MKKKQMILSKLHTGDGKVFQEQLLVRKISKKSMERAIY
jgi:hypothetical protein